MCDYEEEMSDDQEENDWRNAECDWEKIECERFTELLFQCHKRFPGFTYEGNFSEGAVFWCDGLVGLYRIDIELDTDDFIHTSGFILYIKPE